MLFMHQMLDHLACRIWYCFIDDYSRYDQILIAPKGQENNTFTCLYRKFALKECTLYYVICQQFFGFSYAYVLMHGRGNYRGIHG